MKIIKKLLIAIGILVAIFLLIAVFAPKTYHFERSISIKAPADLLLTQTRSLKAMENWSPWKEYDPNMKVEFTGTDGEVGSVSSWVGNEDVGKGSQEITSITPTRVETKLHFLEPFESICKGSIQMDPDGESVKVTWGIDGENPFPWNAMSLFYNMDDAIGKDFDNGLSRLKELTEKMAVELASKPKTYRGYEIHELNYEPKVFIAKKAVLKFEEIGKFYEENLSVICKAVEKAKLKMSGAPTGLFFKWDSEAKTTDMAASVPVVGDDKTKVKGYESVMVQGKALHIAYMGSYEKSGNAHEAMDDYMKEKNLKQGNVVVEEYVTDPMSEPDTNKWLTNIYYILQ